MLKLYHSREPALHESANPSHPVVFCTPAVVSGLPEFDDAPVNADGLHPPHPAVQSACLPNTEMLEVLLTKLHYLSLDQQDNVVNLFGTSIGSGPGMTCECQGRSHYLVPGSQHQAWAAQIFRNGGLLQKFLRQFLHSRLHSYISAQPEGRFWMDSEWMEWMPELSSLLSVICLN